MIFVTSYPYIGPRHIRVFDFFKKKDDLVFILPKVWKMKDGKVIMKAESRPGLNIIPARTFFFHSHYPIIRGHLKGWMPATGRLLKKMSKPGDVLFTVAEPNLLMTYLYGRLAKKLGLKHVFFTWQNVRYEERITGLKLRITKWLIKKNISLSHGAICGNIKARDVLMPYLPVGFKVITNPISGVDTEEFKPIEQSEFREKNKLRSKLILTFVGALDKRKGISTLLESFMTSLAKEPNLHLLLIGAGPLDDFVGAFVSEHGLEKSITRFPWLPNDQLPEILSSSDMFIYPSQPYGGWEEQFGYSVAEASACGLPVISTSSGSIPEKVIHGETGLLVEPGNQEAFVRAILTLASDPDLRKKMGEAGRRCIIEKFGQPIVAQKMEEFFRSL